MPKLSDTMTSGTLTTWSKKVGDRVEIGDILADIETDKASMELENYSEGIILKLYVEAGEQVPIGGPLCCIGEPGEQAPTLDELKEGGSSVGTRRSTGKEVPNESNESSLPEAISPEVSPSAAIETANGAVSRIKASPLARKIAKDKGVALEGLQGSGPDGRIVKQDVLKAAQEPLARPKPSSKNASVPETSVVSGPASPTDFFSTQVESLGEEMEGLMPPEWIAEEGEEPVSNLRGVVARRMQESKGQIPHFYLTSEVDVGPMLSLRVELNNALASLPADQGGSGKLTVNDFILKATAQAIRSTPAINCSWAEKTIYQHGRVHLAFGVAVDHGLVTPVIRDAHLKSLRQISIEAGCLVGKARNKKLKPDEMTGSTFTVTNLGMFDIDHFYGIINPSNAAILSIGRTVKKPVVSAEGEIAIGQRMNLGLSGDHRVIDGAVGAQFLAALKSFIEKPTLMVV